MPEEIQSQKNLSIDTLAEHSLDQVIAAIQDIFFASAAPANVSKDPGKNQLFFAKWTDYYLNGPPAQTLLAWQENRLVGYLMAATNSAAAIPYFQSRVPYYTLFADLFADYPAHLHMNTAPQARGLGVGTQLIDELVRRLRQAKSKGVHLVTSPDQRNVNFYRKNGFTREVTRSWKDHQLLFMARPM